jgi:hypothetical protein
VKALEQDCRDVLRAAKQDPALLTLLEVRPAQLNALTAMYAKISAAATTSAFERDRGDDIKKLDRLQMMLELIFGDVAAAAEWGRGRSSGWKSSSFCLGRRWRGGRWVLRVRCSQRTVRRRALRKRTPRQAPSSSTHPRRRACWIRHACRPSRDMQRRLLVA